MRQFFTDAIYPKSKTKDILMTVAFTGMMIAASKIRFFVPISPLPVTMQTLVVVLSGMMLGSRLGALSMVQFALLGLAGAPVFASGIGGPAAIMTPSFGYILGFIPAAYAAGWAWEKMGKRGQLNAFLAAMLGAFAIYAIGVPWLSAFFIGTKGVAGIPGVKNALISGLFAFIFMDTAKAMIASAVVNKIRK